MLRFRIKNALAHTFAPARGWRFHTTRPTVITCAQRRQPAFRPLPAMRQIEAAADVRLEYHGHARLALVHLALSKRKALILPSAALIILILVDTNGKAPYA